MNSSNKRSIRITRTFSKDLRKLPESVKRDSWNIATLLSENIFDSSVSIKKLHGYENIWRVKLKKSYRLVYTFDENSLHLLRISHRKDIYRKPFQNLD